MIKLYFLSNYVTFLSCTNKTAYVDATATWTTRGYQLPLFAPFSLTRACCRVGGICCQTSDEAFTGPEILPPSSHIVLVLQTGALKPFFRLTVAMTIT